MFVALRNPSPVVYPGSTSRRFNADILQCDWGILRQQLLTQWSRLTGKDIDSAGPSRHNLAALVQRKYGIEARLVENYLRNLERTLPAL